MGDFLEDLIEGQRKCAEFFKAAHVDDFEKVGVFLEEWPRWSCVLHPYAQIKPHQAARSLKMLLLLQKFGADEREISFHLSNLSPEEQLRMTLNYYSS